MRTEVKRLLDQLSRTDDANEAHRIRRVLRKLGHRGGLRTRR